MWILLFTTGAIFGLTMFALEARRNIEDDAPGASKRRPAFGEKNLKTMINFAARGMFSIFNGPDIFEPRNSTGYVAMIGFTMFVMVVQANYVACAHRRWSTRSHLLPF